MEVPSGHNNQGWPGPQVAALVCLFACAGCQELPPRIAVDATAGARTVHTSVDSDLARAALRSPGDERVRAPIAAAQERLADDGLSRDTLAALARDTSVDFAAIMFARYLAHQSANAALRARLEALAIDAATVPPGSRARVVLVPGWAWRSNRASGADLAGPMRALSAAGFAVSRVDTDEFGSVEENAARVAAAVKRLGGDPLILVSASKSAAEVGHALGALLPCADTVPVRAWVNVSGVVQGTPLVELGQSGPGRYAARLSLWLAGLDARALASVSAGQGRARYRQWRLPAHVRVINYLGVPLSGDVSVAVRTRYLQLREFGPNDGITLLADAVLPGAETLTELGHDHFLVGAGADQVAVKLAWLLQEDLRASALENECGAGQPGAGGVSAITVPAIRAQTP